VSSALATPFLILIESIHYPDDFAAAFAMGRNDPVARLFVHPIDSFSRSAIHHWH
jgi:hypothetical protein